MTAQAVMDLDNRLLAKAAGADWLEAGKILLKLPDGQSLGTRALVRAQRLDPSLKSRIEKISRGEDDVPLATSP